jgi:ADP-heptose:LPS heptosyltransferase
MPSEPVAASVLQLVDRLVGIPLCALLTAFRKVADSERRPPTQPGKILFVKFAEQGSTVLAQSAIRRAVEIVGRENVYFVVFQENRFILDVLGLVPEENVITIRRDTFVDLATGTLAALRRMRALGIDTAIDMEFFSRSSAALTYLTGAPRRIGFHTFFGDGPYRGDLMTHRLLYNPYHHTAQIFRLMVEATIEDGNALPTRAATPAPLDREPPAFVVRPGETETVQAMLRECTGGEAPSSILLLNPNASDLLPLRKWETARYIELARRLLERFPECHIAMTGAPNEAGPVAEVARQVGSPRCFSVAGKTSLRQLMVLYTLSDLLITNDSGPAHFAALTPVDVITLFGPETPHLFGAPTPRSTPIWLGLACSPCVNAYNNRQSPCQNNLCMQGITVERVFEEAVRVLERRRSAQAAQALNAGNATVA